MDHNQLNHNLHWGYGNVPPAGPLGPARVPWASAGRAAKHAAPVSESDCDDVFSEGSNKEQCAGDADSCQMMSRKKRRGVIEKKRRDRINTSLTELKRLVPSAYEKQGSAKLEKAEILQMTVDHLKMLHAKGLDNLAYDPHKFAMDYHIVGFRECAAEVARYLVTIEGMDIQDPLRLRLMSHLQCFVTQRELALKQSAAAAATSAAGAWSYAAPPAPLAPPPTAPQHYSVAAGPAAPAADPVNLLHPHHHHHHHHQATPVHQHQHQHPQPSVHDPSLGHYDISTSCASSPTSRHQTPGVAAATAAAAAASSSALASHLTTSTLTPLLSTAPTALGYPSHQYHAYPSTSSSGLPNVQNYNQTTTSSQMKPYRPWGAEVAY